MKDVFSNRIVGYSIDSRKQSSLAVRTLNNAAIDGGEAPGTTTADTQKIADLEREVRELRRANEILKTASASFAAAELDRKLK